MNRAIRPIAIMTCLLLLAAVPARAGQLSFPNVVQVLVSNPNGSQSSDLRLRTVSQFADGGATTQDNKSAGTSSSTTTTPTSSVTSIGSTGLQDGGQAGNIETVEFGDVQGTVCDCGEIDLPGGGFPKWPLLALAAVPLAFLPGGDRENNPGCVFNCGDTPGAPVPEPATLLLLGSGLAALGAGARRRRRQQATEMANLSAAQTKEA